MARLNPLLLIPVAVIGVLGFGGYAIEKRRAESRGELSGFFENQPTEVSSRVPGRVARIDVSEGESVHAGQVLLELESGPASADTTARRAQAEQARAQQELVNKGPRKEDIEKQRAVVAESAAALAKLRNGPLAEEIRASREHLRQAEAMSRKAHNGPRLQDIEQARAAERNARAKLAQSERGLTSEEREQLRARRDSASADENLARRDLQRQEALYREDAISQRDVDRSRNALRTAELHTRDANEALRRALLGTPPEELEQARQTYKQAQAALDELLAGNRPEDIQAADADREAARQNLLLLLRGTRKEDIRAGEAKLAQARASLDALLAGSRAEEKRQAQAQAEAAAATAKSSEETLGEQAVRAPRPGIVERILVAAGDLLQPNTPVIRMSDPADVWIRVYVPESRLATIRPGVGAGLHVDGISGTIPAVVESVAPRGEFTPANLQTPDERGKQVFAVRLRLSRSDPRVKAGMYATVKSIGPANGAGSGTSRP